MVEYDNVKDAVKALCELNSAADITIVDEDGNIRQATLEDIQEDNREILYQLADLLGIDLEEAEQ